ncbi:RNA degradosome polyphosphate kinase, partial [bacterium]|nr:RNA degradosome polyphosphate kinase [bacterium]
QVPALLISLAAGLLVDTEVIDALYRASQAGVKILLNVRGVCCLRPGVPGLSETIRVISIVDRFLEHARIIHFRHGGDSELFISSADWMPRNLDRRVEIMVPVDEPKCREKVMNSLLTYFQDNCNSWEMQADGSYTRSNSDKDPVRAQEQLYQRACQATEQIRQKLRTTFETHEPPQHR